jgi:DNA polymerase elongation subunit (family B)
MAKKKDKRAFWAGDCETDPFKHGRVPRPFIWGVYTGAAYHEFDTIDEFVEFIRECEVIIYFHNGGKFDLHFLLKHINLFEDVKVINGRLVVAKIGKAELRDSWNLLPIPLAQYKKDDAAAICFALIEAGIPAKEANKLATDYAFMEETARRDPRVMRVIRKYLRNDCVFLYELVSQFEADYGRHLTQASAALATWKKMSGMRAPQTDKNYFNRFAQYYYGGRVQCFQKGKIEGPVKVYDIRSAYPDAMLSEHPYFPDWRKIKGPSDFGVTDMLTVDCVSNGALPFRDDRGKILFPDDGELRRYFVPGHELRAAMDTGSVRRVDIVESVVFAKLVSFADYINHFYQLRKEARTAGIKAVDIFCKLLMNSLYGKFGANPENYGNFMCVPFQEFEQHEGDGYKFNGMIGPHALLRAALDENEMRFLNVATAASITSQVRAKLWRAISVADDPIYCDTDSIICRGSAVEIGERLGQWSFEGTGEVIHVAGKKMYLVEGGDFADKPKMATKGVRLTPNQIRRMCDGETVLYEPQAPTFSLVRPPAFVSRAVKMT